MDKMMRTRPVDRGTGRQPVTSYRYEAANIETDRANNWGERGGIITRKNEKKGGKGV